MWNRLRRWWRYRILRQPFPTGFVVDMASGAPLVFQTFSDGRMVLSDQGIVWVRREDGTWTGVFTGEAEIRTNTCP